MFAAPAAASTKHAIASWRDETLCGRAFIVSPLARQNPGIGLFVVPALFYYTGDFRTKAYLFRSSHTAPSAAAGGGGDLRLFPCMVCYPRAFGARARDGGVSGIL